MVEEAFLFPEYAESGSDVEEPSTKRAPLSDSEEEEKSTRFPHLDGPEFIGLIETILHSSKDFPIKVGEILRAVVKNGYLNAFDVLVNKMYKDKVEESSWRFYAVVKAVIYNFSASILQKLESGSSFQDLDLMKILFGCLDEFISSHPFVAGVPKAALAAMVLIEHLTLREEYWNLAVLAVHEHLYALARKAPANSQEKPKEALSKKLFAKLRSTSRRAGRLFAPAKDRPSDSGDKKSDEALENSKLTRNIKDIGSSQIGNSSAVVTNILHAVVKNGLRPALTSLVAIYNENGAAFSAWPYRFTTVTVANHLSAQVINAAKGGSSLSDLDLREIFFECLDDFIASFPIVSHMPKAVLAALVLIDNLLENEKHRNPAVWAIYHSLLASPIRQGQ